MKKKTCKSSKLRDIICFTCGTVFQNRVAPSEMDRKMYCSISCMNKQRAILRLLREKHTNCIKCGKEIILTPSAFKRGEGIYCSRSCAGLSIKERTMTTDGYWQIPIIKNGAKTKIKEHRYIMQNYLGRELLSREIVHHINFNKLDNRIDNLYLCNSSEHGRLHKRGCPPPLPTFSTRILPM